MQVAGGQSGKRALHTEARARSNFFPRTSPLVFGQKPRERFWERGWIWLHCEGTLSALLLTPLGLTTSVSTYDTKKVGIKLSMRKKKLVPQLACCRFPRALNYNGLFQCIFQGQITFRLGVFGCVAY